MSYVPSHSARQSWKTCNRKYYYGYVLNLEPDVDDRQGLRMGKAFASLLDGEPHGYSELLDSAEDQSAYDHLAEELVVLEELAAGYRARYAERDEGIKTEVEFDSPYLGRGRIDGLKGSWAKEDKLLTKWWQTESVDTDQILEQVTAYFAAMKEAGTPLEVIEYRVTWKPKMLKRTDGKWFRKKNQSLEEYREALRASIAEAPGEYFTSRDYYRTDEQIAEFQMGVAMTLAQIRASARVAESLPDGKVAYPQSTGACQGKFGRCEFADLCVKGDLAMPSYKQRERN